VGYSSPTVLKGTSKLNHFIKQTKYFIDISKKIGKFKKGLAPFNSLKLCLISPTIYVFLA